MVLTFGLAFIFIQSCRNRDTELPGIPAPKPFQPDYPAYLKSFYTEPTGNPTTVEGIALGKDLFFEKALSLDYSISCASCHRPEHAFSDTTAFSSGIGGQKGKRNAPSLLNSALFRRFFWDGRDSSLESQAIHPILDPTEMGLGPQLAVSRLNSIASYPEKFRKAFGDKEITIDRIAKAIAQFERSLVSGNSRYDRFLQGKYNPDSTELLGMQLFFTHPDPFAAPSGLRGGNCGDCHLPQTLMGDPNGFDGFHNTGLARAGGAETGLQKLTGKPGDFGRFKTPGLRNIALTPPYMHDGRFRTLEQVLEHYNADTLFQKPNLDVLMIKGTNDKFGTSLGLRDDEKNAIIRFLHMLTDSTAIQQ